MATWPSATPGLMSFAQLQLAVPLWSGGQVPVT